MIMSYWAIYGYGVEDIGDLISEDKIIKLIGNEEANLIDYAFEHYDKDGNKCFYFADNGEGEISFLYTPSLPFELHEQEKAFKTREDIKVAMYESIKEILLDDVTLENFKEKMDWVSTYGAG